MKQLTSKDLRIGNYVNEHGGNDQTFFKAGQPRYLARIAGLGESYIEWKKETDTPSGLHSTIEAIPLTEEWLLGFGFEIKEGKATKDWFELYLGEDTFVYKLYVKTDGIITFSHIGYVHELQNLYYTLTGSELVLASGSKE